MTEDTTAEPGHSDVAVRLNVQLDPYINFALQQNDVPVVKEIRLENVSSTPIKDLQLEVRAEPAFIATWKQHIEVLPETATHILRTVDLLLLPDFLASLSERMRGILHFTLSTGDTTVASHAEPVELLAYDEWSGLQSLPEILAAFVLPNHPSVEAVLVRASDVLRAHTNDSSLTGYQSRSRERVWNTVEAIFTALSEQDLRYSSPPASFEQTGQKIRTPDRILDNKLATCLDLAALAAACLEQAGLHPLIVVMRGHAFVGVWLDDDCFAQSAEDDLLKLRKRVDLDEIGVFEATCLTNTPRADFAHAMSEGKKHLQVPENFLCMIDVYRARKSSIRPLPLRTDGGKTVVVHTQSASTDTSAPSRGPGVSERQTPEPTADTPQTRLDAWCRKLLDLTLHNRLLNYKDSRKTIPLICPDLNRLEDLLAEGATFQMRARPTEFGAADPRDADAFRRRTGDEGLQRLVKEELKAKRLCGDVTPEELDRRLIELYRSARISIEEGGASALYLAIGFVRWYETKRSEKPLLAPLLLVPVELERKSIQQGFRLCRSTDDTRVNTTLLELLRRDFDLVISGLDPLPQDDSGVDVATVLRRFKEAVKDIDRWEVLDTASIGFFSFAKFLMWRDLQERSDELMNSPVVRHLIERDGSSFDPDFVTQQPERLDEIHDPRECFTPIDADSSQLWAVLNAAQGRSFVLEGPPGTGKSQTITNIIAHALATGKTVLFVSEKSAALNVVFSRLKKLGLDRFCLELHSNKSRKHDVIQQLGEVFQVAVQQPSEDWQRKANKLAQLRNQLNAVVEALHRRRSNGLTVFFATSQLTALKDVPRALLGWPNPNQHTPDTLEQLHDAVEAVAAIAARVGELDKHPWRFLSVTDWTHSWQDAVQQAVADAMRIASETKRGAVRCSPILGMQQAVWTRERLAAMNELAHCMLMRPALPAAMLESPSWTTVLRSVQEWIQIGQQRDQLRAKVYNQFKKGALDRDLSSLLDAWEQILSRNPLPSPLGDLEALGPKVSSWLELIRDRNRLRAAVLTVFKKEILLADTTHIHLLWERVQTAGTLMRWLAVRRARRAIRPLLNTNVTADSVILAALSDLTLLTDTSEALRKVAVEARAVFGELWRHGEPDVEHLEKVRDWIQDATHIAQDVNNSACDGEPILPSDIRGSLRDAVELKGHEQRLDQVRDEAIALLGPYWRDGEADWKEVRRALQWVSTVRKFVSALSPSDEVAHSEQRGHLAKLLVDSRDALKAEGELGRALQLFQEHWSQLLKEREKLVAVLKIDLSALPADENSASYLDDLVALLNLWSASLNRLRDWCDWNHHRSKASRLGLGPLIQDFERGTFSREQLSQVFKRSYFEWWLGKIVDSEDVLRRFSSTQHERLIVNFRQMDREYLSLTREIIAARLAERVPQTSSNIVPNSEMGILQHELRKTRRHTSVRTLVGKIPSLLPRLKPCLLMSPMSVAQYLDPSFPPFDMVVFDEASQIPVWDAVGAIARGKQAIVVGDPKQLPPTNFFMRSDEEPDDVEETLQDLESVLDDCLGAQIPQLYLGWHYRSRHESLILFSNYHYYDNRLLTFPSPNPEGMGVQWRFVVDGVYGRSKDRTNRPEAERVVAEVLKRLRDRALREQSIGVVTFSVAQQALVEELLDRARRDAPEIERFFSEDEVAEPVFVKNLENVQGDERDVIIFSICYGPDQNGIVSLNFGPINRVGGERRLNVAVTRARRELLVYSSLRADMINLARTKALGAAHLKTFLDFAERGRAALPSATALRDGAECESPLEQQVHDALTKRGWQLHKQVGCSGYRIDLAVLHPETPGRYAIGIECDGANYHRARSARDRDRLREAVLRDLGWDLARVWSTDWWTDPRREVEKLEQAIGKAIENIAAATRSEADRDEPDDAEIMPPVPPALVKDREPLIAAGVAPASTYLDGTEHDRAPGFPVYKPFRVEKILGSQADFDSPYADDEIAAVLAAVVAAEGPVAFPVACRRVAAHWGFQKATGRIQEIVRKRVASTGLRLHVSGDIEFLWPKDTDPEACILLRVNGLSRDTSRNVDEIPLEELANGVLHLLKTHFGMPADDLRKATARLFGFQRTGVTVVNRIDLALQLLLKRQAISDKNGLLSLT